MSKTKWYSKPIYALVALALVLSLGIMAMPLAGTVEAGVPPLPTEVWVDDSWAGSTPGQTVGGHTFGYDAFATIQDGIDAVAGGTVHVLAGTYDAFMVDTRDGISIIGEPGAVVNGAMHPEEEEAPPIMAGVGDSTNIDITGLDFDGTGITGDMIMGIVYVESTGSITDVTVSNIVGDTMGFGIMVVGSGLPTVDISGTTIEGCTVGVWVMDDHVTLDNCTITGLADEDIPGAGILACMGAAVNVADCAISDFRVQSPELGFENGPEAGFGILVGMPGEDDTATVTVTGCSRIFDNNYGIYVDDDGDLVANGNQIYGNTEYGIYKENAPSADATENWWGAADGPSHSQGSGDKVSDNVYCEPWLDAPCPDGKPIYSWHAAFSATPSSGPAPLGVKFTDESTGDIDSWHWDFGDGKTSTAKNPSHAYAAPGRYTVTLTVAGLGGARDTATVTITVIPMEDVEKPARMTTSSLHISNPQVQPDQQVEISINVSNTGGKAGVYNAVLYINGYPEQSQMVSVAGGSTQNAVFHVTKSTPGAYQVLLEGEVGQFTVLTPQETSNFGGGGLGTGGIIAIVVIAIALIVAMVLLFARTKQE